MQVLLVWFMFIAVGLMGVRPIQGFAGPSSGSPLTCNGVSSSSLRPFKSLLRSSSSSAYQYGNGEVSSSPSSSSNHANYYSYGPLSSDRLLSQIRPHTSSRLYSALEDVQNVVADQLGVDKSKLHPDSNFIKDLGADSLDSVELVMALEEKFGVEIPDEEATKITTVQHAVDYIEKHKKQVAK